MALALTDIAQLEKAHTFFSTPTLVSLDHLSALSPSSHPCASFSKMVYKVAGACSLLTSITRGDLTLDFGQTDISLAAFGRKEIEIAEVGHHMRICTMAC